ncbi:MAG: acyl carrier protein [Pseudonocardiales bacterium]|nr:acyl carrier protein [Pseudonocardiales bacterium]MBV9029310.1 acyl carrier protein [Pseudonocardiales bacterium]MBW0009556.1 acyl carrier protein [Pseudonocardiales bacterium]
MRNVSVDKEELRALVADVLELPVEEVTDDADFVNDLEVDSLVALEIAVRLEKKYGVKMTDSELMTLSSLNWVHQLVKSKLDDAA